MKKNAGEINNLFQ